MVIELLTKEHGRKAFDCGVEGLNDFLKTKARKHAESHLSVTWVEVEEGQKAILGYITISMGNVAFEEVDEEIAKKLPRHPIPVLHVGRLATDVNLQGRGVGTLLLNFAAAKAVEASQNLGCFAVELIAGDQKAYDYYLRRGYLPLKKDTMRLYMPTATLKEAYEQLASRG